MKRSVIGRRAWLLCAGALSATNLTACSRDDKAARARQALACLPPTDARFDMGGLSLAFDAMAGQEFFGVEFYADEGVRPFFAKSRLTFENASFMGLGVKRLPRQVRAVWRKTDKGARIGWGSALLHFHDSGKPRSYEEGSDLEQRRAQNPWSPEEEIAKRKLIAANTGIAHHGPWSSDYGDEVLGDELIPVLERLPQDVFDGLCKHGGALRLKFRLSREGVYFGWDVGRPRGKAVPPNDTVSSRADHFVIGGEFREGEIYNGKPVRRGWYIDKKTGQKIETDF
jgi:hypothetical protein